MELLAAGPITEFWNGAIKFLEAVAGIPGLTKFFIGAVVGAVGTWYIFKKRWLKV